MIICYGSSRKLIHLWIIIFKSDLWEFIWKFLWILYLIILSLYLPPAVPCVEPWVVPDCCLSSALAFPSDLGARRPCRGLRGWGCPELGSALSIRQHGIRTLARRTCGKWPGPNPPLPGGPPSLSLILSFSPYSGWCVVFKEGAFFFSSPGSDRDRPEAYLCTC